MLHMRLSPVPLRHDLQERSIDASTQALQAHTSARDGSVGLRYLDRPSSLPTMYGQWTVPYHVSNLRKCRCLVVHSMYVGTSFQFLSDARSMQNGQYHISHSRMGTESTHSVSSAHICMYI